MQDFVASFVKGADLNQLLVNRKNGATIVLQIGVPGTPETRLVTLTERHGMHVAPGKEWGSLMGQ